MLCVKAAAAAATHFRRVQAQSGCVTVCSDCCRVVLCSQQVGYTKAAIFPLPEGVLGLCVKPSLMYLYGVDKQLVTNTAAAIRAVRKPNAYTGNGIQLVGETIKLKQRAGSK